MDKEKFIMRWSSLTELPKHIQLRNDAVYYVDRVKFLNGFDGIDRLDLYLNNKNIGYCKLVSIKEVY
jgi:hypothetical protein